MVILGKKIKIGKTTLYLDIAKLHTGTPIDIPVIIQRSRVKGPTVLLLAGIHGNEVNGVEIVRQIIRKKLNVPIKGTIICIPVVNVFGFLNQERHFPDGRDLNRVFPGNKSGSLASRFAYHLMQEIVPHIDYCIDFHTGGNQRFNHSQLRIDASDKVTLKLAQVFGVKFIISSSTRAKSFRKSATSLGKKTLLFEGGKTLYLDKNITQNAIDGTLRVLQHLKMGNYDEYLTDSIKEEQHLIQKSSWIRASKSGMYRNFVKLGAFVKKGNILASISDPYGKTERMVKAPFDGFIICKNQAPLVNQGDALLHISRNSNVVN